MSSFVEILADGLEAARFWHDPRTAITEVGTLAMRFFLQNSDFKANVAGVAQRDIEGVAKDDAKGGCVGGR